MIATAPRNERPLAVGDYVTIVDGPRALTWKILDIHGQDGSIEYGTIPFALLESGQSGRHRLEYLDNLTLFPRSQA